MFFVTFCNLSTFNFVQKVFTLQANAHVGIERTLRFIHASKYSDHTHTSLPQSILI